MHKNTYAHIIYTVLCIMFLMRAYPFRVFGPQMALAYRLDAISQVPKNSRFPGPNPSHLPEFLLRQLWTVIRPFQCCSYCSLLPLNLRWEQLLYRKYFNFRCTSNVVMDLNKVDSMWMCSSTSSQEGMGCEVYSIFIFWVWKRQQFCRCVRLQLTVID